MRLLLGTSLTVALAALGCGGSEKASDTPAPAPARPERPARPEPMRSPRDEAFLQEVEQRTFHWFWETTNAENGLVPDRWPTKSFSSVAAVGFGLTAYPIGIERGFITREEGRQRAKVTLEFFLNAPQGKDSAGMTGYKGFFYHFLDMKTGARYAQVELSTIDTALFLAGALTCAQYFDRDDPDEAAIRAAADALYRRAEWDWAVVRPPLVSMAWTPEQGFGGWDYRGYNEAMLLYVLALGSPTHPIRPIAWRNYTTTYRWDSFAGGEEHVNFGPLFGHQYSHVWIDFRGIQDAYMRLKEIDYFENSRRATLSQQLHAIANPRGWAGWGARDWGLSACDGPYDGKLPVNGETREFWTYAARGISAREQRDDGTLTPTAVAASIPFAPEVCIPTLQHLAVLAPGDLYTEYGFVDAFNPAWQWDSPRPKMGKLVPGKGWFDTDYLGIDQGPILAMIENHRSELIWRLMRKNPHVVEGLRRAAFGGGWLDAPPG